MYTQIENFIQSLEPEVKAIDEQRKSLLDPIVGYVSSQLKQEGQCSLNFICTHNSRRSHMGQLWAQSMATYYGVPGIKTFSGGTEATAFNPNAIKALAEAGFSIVQESGESNPVYLVKSDDTDSGQKAWSKVFSDPVNPSGNFGAIMTCQEADEACPFVPGASFRVALSYQDPKAFDGTDLQDQKYMERSRQIAAEMKYVFRKGQPDELNDVKPILGDKGEHVP